MATLRGSSPSTTQAKARNLTSSSAVRHASLSPSPDSVAVFRTLEEALRSPLSSWSPRLVPDGSAGKTSPVLCLPTADGLSLPSSGGFKNSGMASPGACWMLSTSEWTAFPEQSLNDAGVSSLSDILQETCDVPLQFFLSQRACAGIVRRAAGRGKKLPEPLGEALKQVSQQSAEPSPMELTTEEG